MTGASRKGGAEAGKAPPVPTTDTLPEPTKAELEAIGTSAKRQLARPARVKIRVATTAPAAASVSPPHSNGDGWNAQLHDTLGTCSTDYAHHALGVLFSAVGAQGKTPTNEQINAGLALMAAIEPRDELEAAIAQQIIASHVASLEFLNRARLNAGEYRDAACAYVNAATKLSRTMAVQIEAINKLRTGGKQTHEVRYVYVNGPVLGPGAQAVFGAAGGGLRGSIFGQPQEAQESGALAFAPGVEVRSEDSPGDPLPIAGREREGTMSNARWGEGLWRAEREGERAVPDGAAHAGTTEGEGAGPRSPLSPERT
jgi:hypothetical protein